MRVRRQIIEGGVPTLDTTFMARTEYSALHEMLKFYDVEYDPGKFRRRGNWVEFKSHSTVYRTMSERHFG